MTDLTIRFWLLVAELSSRTGYYSERINDYAMRRAFAYSVSGEHTSVLRRDSEVN